MLNLNLSFGVETMLFLSHEQFQQLVSSGETTIPHEPAKAYYIDENFSRLFLSVNGSLSNYFFEFEPEKDIDIFIDNAYLTNFYPKTGKVKLIDGYAEPLKVLLPRKAPENKDIAVFEKSHFLQEEITFNNVLIEGAMKELETGNFKGQISCCDCGEPGCSSEYLWAEHNVGLVRCRIVAASLIEVQLFPFRFS